MHLKAKLIFVFDLYFSSWWNGSWFAANFFYWAELLHQLQMLLDMEYSSEHAWQFLFHFGRLLSSKSHHLWQLQQEHLLLCTKLKYKYRLDCCSYDLTQHLLSIFMFKQINKEETTESKYIPWVEWDAVFATDFIDPERLFNWQSGSTHNIKVAKEIFILRRHILLVSFDFHHWV